MEHRTSCLHIHDLLVCVARDEVSAAGNRQNTVGGNNDRAARWRLEKLQTIQRDIRVAQTRFQQKNELRKSLQKENYFEYDSEVRSSRRIELSNPRDSADDKRVSITVELAQ